MNQSQTSVLQRTSFDSVCENKVESYVRALLRDTLSGGLKWYASKTYSVPAFEFLYESNVVQIVFAEMTDGKKVTLTLYVNRIGNLRDIGSIVVQLQTDKEAFASPGEDDPLILLWRAVTEQADHAKEKAVFDHIDTYLSRSKQIPSAEELITVAEWACEELINAVKDYKTQQ